MRDNDMRGYFGIGIVNGKNGVNLGTLWRSAYQMGAVFIFTVGHRYKPQSSDTYMAYRHMPLYQYPDWQAFINGGLYDCMRIAVEMGGEPLITFDHPQRAVYLLGAEDNGIPPKIIGDCHKVVELPSVRQPSFNVAVAGSIVMYDRIAKQARG